jgi:hypothetical protein
MFRKGNFYCFVEQEESESREYYLKRGHFIANQRPMNQVEYDEAVLYSKIYMHVKYSKCIYSPSIMKKLEDKLSAGN